MGAAPRASPEHVARSFIGVYYRVAAKMPARLSELYSSSSELHHGPGLSATGAIAIKALSQRLPIATTSVSISSLRYQQTGNGAYLVSVIGSFGPNNNISDLSTGNTNINHQNDNDDDSVHKTDSYLYRLRTSNVIFSHSFVLEKLPDSHDDHFFCRNDIFTPVMLDGQLFAAAKPDEPLPPIHPANTSDDSSNTNDITSKDLHVDQVRSINHPTSSSTTDSQSVNVKNDFNAALVDSSDPISKNDTHSINEVISVPLSDTIVNGTATNETDTTVTVTATLNENIVNESSTTEIAIEDPIDSIPVVTTSTTEDISVQTSTLPNGVPNTENTSVRIASAIPVKKTWASIVSSKDDIVTNGPVTTEDSNSTTTRDVINTISIESKSSTISTTQPSNIGDSTHLSSKNQSNGQRTGHHQYGHINRNNNQRQYGPSAVVQLSSLSANLLQDARSLSLSMRDEFSSYGYRARHVEVKIQKGIAFVEYDSMEGVKAAVAAWANGPRTEGDFAGIALNVSEKRPFYNRRPNNMRGGRSGTRGGRRNNNNNNRPTSTPVN